MTILTTSNLLEDIKIKASLTSGQAGLADSALLRMATGEMVTCLVPEVLAVHQGFLLHKESQAIVAGQAEYDMPRRANYGTIEHIWYEKTDGTRYPLHRFRQENWEQLPTSTGNMPQEMLVIGNSLHIFPTPSSSATGSLVFVYTFRPNNLVTESSCKQIQSYDTNSITVSSIPVNFTTGIKYDIVNNESGNEIIAHDLTCTDITSTTATFSDDLSAYRNLSNSWMCEAGYSPVPMLPEELHDVLVEMTVVRVLQARKDQESLKAALGRLKLLRENLGIGLVDRVETKPDVVTGGNIFFLQDY